MRANISISFNNVAEFKVPLEQFLSKCAFELLQSNKKYFL